MHFTPGDIFACYIWRGRWGEASALWSLPRHVCPCVPLTHLAPHKWTGLPYLVPHTGGRSSPQLLRGEPGKASHEYTRLVAISGEISELQIIITYLMFNSSLLAPSYLIAIFACNCWTSTETCIYIKTCWRNLVQLINSQQWFFRSNFSHFNWQFLDTAIHIPIFSVKNSMFSFNWSSIY